MPIHFGKDLSDSDSDEDRKIKRDEYGDIFEDYGFLKRAEEYKEKGNSEFKKERFERALKEYDMCLEQLLTVAYDKSIVLGKRKWNDVVIMRSTVHLNKSTCHYKLERWQQAVDEAMECLVGNIRDEQMFTDPHIRNKVKQSERKTGRSDVTLTEHRLPRPVRAKAWFRLSRCYAHLTHLDKAKDAMAKALEMCDDEQLFGEMSQHALRIDVLEKQQKERQKKQFRGFWDKLQERGGYVEKRVEREAQRKAHWDSLNYQEKFAAAEELDNSDDEDDMPPLQGSRPAAAPGAAGLSATEKADLEELMRCTVPRGQADLESAQEQGFEGNSWSARAQREQGQDPWPPPPAEERTPARPHRNEEAPLRWLPGGEPRAAAEAPALEQALDPAEAWARRSQEAAKKERQRISAYERRRREELEEEELRKARERVARQRQQKTGEHARARMEALDDSDDG